MAALQDCLGGARAALAGFEQQVLALPLAAIAGVLLLVVLIAKLLAQRVPSISVEPIAITGALTVLLGARLLRIVRTIMRCIASRRSPDRRVLAAAAAAPPAAAAAAGWLACRARVPHHHAPTLHHRAITPDPACR